MNAYDFVLTFSFQEPSDDPEKYVEILGENGCTDALVGIGRLGSISLDFTREAESAHEAIFSAIFDIKQSIPHSQFTEIQPDIVGITDIAELVNRTRQNIRKLIFSDGAECPPPMHGGNSALWHLYDVLKWLQQDKGYDINQEFIELAKITKSLNASRVWHQIEPDMRKQAEAITTPKQTELTALSL
jgi:hypothetical protein